QEKVSTGRRGAREGLLLFSDKIGRVLRRRIADSRFNDPVVRGVAVGINEEPIAITVNDAVVVFHIINYRNKSAARILQVFDIQFIATGAAAGGNDQVAVIFSKISRSDTTLNFISENYLITALRSVKLMVIDFLLLISLGQLLAFLRTLIAAVVKAFVTFPGDTGKFEIHQGIADHLLSFGIQRNSFTPVGAAVGYEIGHQRAVIRKESARH